MEEKSSCTLLSVIIISFAVIGFSNTEDNSRLLDVLKKSTNSSGNYSRNIEDDVFKAEAMKVIKKCQTDNSDKKNESNSNNNNNNGYSRGYNGYNNYNNENNTRDTDYRNNGYGYNNYSNRNNKNSYGSYEYGSNGNGRVSTMNCTDRRSRLGGDTGDDTNTNDDYGHNQGTYYSSYRGGGNNGNIGFDRNYFSARVRRDNGRNNDNQCVSQCVFGYMDLVDENQNPSETLTIKWLQEHISSNDLKRIKALRDVRRCFAKLSTSDIEDGCEFSKELSKCLDLDLE